MKIIYPTAGTRQFYQMNALTHNLKWYVAPTGPHTITLRGEYTVPTGRSALLCNVYMQVYRFTAATTVSDVEIRAEIYDGVTEGDIAIINTKSNVVGYTENKQSALNIWLTAGMHLRTYTMDVSTGGTVEYRCCVVYLEFEAGVAVT